MALNKVEICGVNTARLPLLKNEEKEALFERIKEGDSEARELYIKGNLRAGLKCDSPFRQQQRERRRPLSDRLHRPYEGH